MASTHAISLAFLAACALGCGNTDGQPACTGGSCDGQGELPRSVVVPEHPLALTNPQQYRVTWPLWGSAFTTDAESVTMRVALAPTGSAGIAIAMPGSEESRRAFEIMYDGASWSLAETMGGTPVQQVALASAPATIEILRGGRTISVGGAELTSRTAALIADGPMGIYVQLDPGAELAVTDVALSQPLPAPASALGSPLQQLARAKGRAIGSTSETGEYPPRHDLAFESMWAEQFDAAGILDFYWTTTRGEDDDFYFLPADLLVNYAQLHHQAITGYFLVWDEELPSWVGELAQAQGATGLGAALDHHIETIVDRYRGRVSTWIVANEAFLGPDETGTGKADYAESVWFDTLGPDYIAHAFRTADATDPAATLVYNETGAEAEGAKSDFLYARMQELVADHVPIDAVGLQFHIDAAAPPDMASVKRNMERLGALGLDVLITELDVSLANFPGTHAERLAKQAEIFGQITETCLAVPACKTMTLFGFSDKHAWDELGPSVCKPEGDKSLCSEPLIFDRAYEPKPAYHAVVSALGS